MAKTRAINEKKIIALNAEIEKYYILISNVFDQIDFEMSNLKDFIDCASYQTIVNKYNLIRRDYSKIKTGINNYSEDYACLIRKYKANSEYMASLFDDFTKLLRSESKINKGE